MFLLERDSACPGGPHGGGGGLYEIRDRPGRLEGWCGWQRGPQMQSHMWEGSDLDQGEGWVKGQQPVSWAQMVVWSFVGPAGGTWTMSQVGRNGII